MYQLEVDHPEYAILRRDDVRAVAGKESEAAAVVLERSASISGTALTRGGQPLTGVAVYLAATHGGTGGGEATTDGRGRFSFGRLRPGEYQLTCFGRNPNLGAMLSAAVGADRPTPFMLERAQQLDVTVVAIE
jgi:hypothetical protein